MRKITSEACAALMGGYALNKQNMRVYEASDGWGMMLFGNLIAQHLPDDKILAITTAGWNTNTTRERLNGLPGVHVYKNKGILHLNGEVWDGKWKTIKY